MVETTTPQRPGHLSREELSILERRLGEERRRLLAEHGSNAAHDQEVAAALADPEDPVDRAGETMERERIFAAESADSERLVLVDEALARLAAGSYGICLHDGDEIPYPRLREVPWARYCARVQARLENGELVETAEGLRAVAR